MHQIKPFLMVEVLLIPHKKEAWIHYLLLNDGVENFVYISGHAFGITADVNVSTLGDHVPDFRCLKWTKVDYKSMD